MFNKFFSLIGLLSLTVSVAVAQSGIIRGQLTSSETGEELIGATVVIKGTNSGTATDLDGKFSFNNLQPGTYELQASYVSYEPKAVAGVVVKDGEVTVVDIRLGSSTTALKEVVVEARAIRSSEGTLRNIQRKSALVMDGISAEQITRSGDSDAASALTRVTGISVEGSKYVYVRGLGDRYVKTALNGAEIPGLDPNRNTVQMDLFPSNLLDNLTVSKTFTPDLPGSFSGGYVNITTKDFPDRYTLQLSSSVGYNSQATFNSNFLSSNKGGLDWLGFDDDTRAVPDEIDYTIPSESFTNQERAEQIDKATKAFNTEMAPSRMTAPVNHSHTFSLGNQTELFGKQFGYVVGLSYQRNFSYYDNGSFGVWKLKSASAEELDNNKLFSDERGVEEVTLGLLANFSYKLNNNNKISLNLMRNQNGQNSSRFLSGTYPENFGVYDESAIFESRALHYIQRSLTSGQLKGEHVLPGFKNSKVDWLASFTLSQQDEPDLRFFANDYFITGADTAYSIRVSNYSPPSRFFRNLDETNLDLKLNLETPFTIWNGLEAKTKFGVAALLKDRSFRENIYRYRFSNAYNYNGNVEEFFAPENLGIVMQPSDPESGGIYNYGVYLQDGSQRTNNYDGEESVYAGYAMIDLPVTEKLRVVAGARLEATDIYVESFNPLLEPGNLNQVDILPSVNTTYSLTEKMNFRLGYSRTLARPNFREIAPYTSFDFVGEPALVGNANLKRTLIDNFDARWEWYPAVAEYIGVSAYYKNFQNPIERTINTLAQNPQIDINNVDNAKVYGLEFEINKRLSFVTPSLENFLVGANLSLTKSQVNISESELALIRTLNPEAESTRPMFGQSPFVANATLSYQSEPLGLVATASFNMFGDRISAISIGGTPNIYERSRPIAGLVVSKRISEHFSAKVSANNILNPAYKHSHEYKGEEYIYSSYKVGRDFSVGLTYLIN
ncbi:TonB-dependent receptor domain-containing protein [Pontibacter silvestris]|uniref:TonB-dependent receptor domain-containing protein n=1 Tax=Pontibacter silvestris TaxID=2305183 RepID=A0ABW4X5J1_9BACT|nr:TonB-dependent receptor [Pontibacter silvestris]MCC9137093.1 TonB-dependent receptor [Pontibacter silvestris]